MLDGGDQVTEATPTLPVACLNQGVRVGRLGGMGDFNRLFCANALGDRARTEGLLGMVPPPPVRLGMSATLKPFVFVKW